MNRITEAFEQLRRDLAKLGPSYRRPPPPARFAEREPNDYAPVKPSRGPHWEDSIPIVAPDYSMDD